MDEDSYHIAVTHHREGSGSLTQSITCDAETALTWLAAIAHEIACSLQARQSPSWREQLRTDK